jgi:hypothetical protein
MAERVKDLVALISGVSGFMGDYVICAPTRKRKNRTSLR